MSCLRRKPERRQPFALPPGVFAEHHPAKLEAGGGVFRRWTRGDALAIDVALLSSFAIGAVIVVAILLFDFGRRR